MKKANRMGAGRVIIIGQDELKNGNVLVKDMSSGEQQSVKQADLSKVLS